MICKRYLRRWGRDPVDLTDSVLLPRYKYNKLINNKL